MNHCRVYMRVYLSLRLLATKVTSLSLYYLLYYRGCVAPHSTLSLSLSLRLFGGGPHLCTDCVDEVPQVSGGLLQAVW